MASSSPDLSLILVTYHSSAELEQCLLSFRAQADALGLVSEVLVVDHSEDPDEEAALKRLGPDRLLVLPNHGYAAGLNAGAACSGGRVLVLANPDIELLDGSLGAMLEALSAGWSVVGPRFVWDQEGSVCLPVPEDPDPGAELRRQNGRVSRRAWQGVLHDQLASARVLWSPGPPVEAPSLRGAVMVLERAMWERLGPLDEGYFLYFEETEWLWRASRSGARLAVVPSATVVHHWGHATQRLVDRDGLQLQSYARFLRRNYSLVNRWLVQRMQRKPSRVGVSSVRVTGPEEVRVEGAELWQLSPFSHLMPSAGWLGAEVPPAVGSLTQTGPWYLVATRDTGSGWEILGSWHWGEP